MKKEYKDERMGVADLAEEVSSWGKRTIGAFRTGISKMRLAGIGVALVEMACCAMAVGCGKTEEAKAVERQAGETMTFTLPGGETMEMIWCPPGEFVMGNAETQDEEERQHNMHVTLTKGFWMAKTEVTQRQWRSVMGSNPAALEEDDPIYSRLSNPDVIEALRTQEEHGYPVYSVCWDECADFCRRAGLTLPTEAQWEYACRAGSTGAYGGTGVLEEMGWYEDNSGVIGVHPVGEKAPNAWGFLDMHGNVEEWCADWGDEYPAGAATDPTGPETGEGRILRGGSFDDREYGCRSYCRGIGKPESRRSITGFRPVLADPAGHPAPLREPEAGATRIFNLPGKHAMRFTWCPPGTFTMGSPADEEGRNAETTEDGSGGEVQHEVTLTRGFWMGKTEVTQGEWEAVMGTTVVDLARKALLDDTPIQEGKPWRELIGIMLGMELAKDFDPADLCGNEDNSIPVYYVTWDDACEFCRRLTALGRREGWLPEDALFRLPTEAEWEYACRAGTTTALPNGQDIRIGEDSLAPALDDIAWYSGNSYQGFYGRGWRTPQGTAGARRVGLKNANAWGLYDMLGNMWEWCSDRFGPVSADAVKDPTGGQSGHLRVNRGGSWDNSARSCRPARRDGCRPEMCDWGIGFRVVCSGMP